MGYIVTATCNGVSTSMEVQRPSLSRLEKQYADIYFWQTDPKCSIK